MSQTNLFPKRTTFEENFERCESAWQRVVMQEWARLHPEPLTFQVRGPLNGFQLVPIPCTCTRCGAPSLIIPQEKGEPATASYCICPRCSMPKSETVAI